MKTLDVRGQACPRPVILARKALADSDALTVIVDNDTARMNVARMAEKAGYRVEAKSRQDGIYLHIAKPASDASAAQAAGSSGDRVVLVASDGLGRGNAELGSILIRAFFHTLNESKLLPATIVFINSGVQLVAEGSAVLEDLRALCDKGVAVWACGTCLDYYGLKQKVAVGEVSNMYSIAEALLQAQSVISI
jgi:selenium metabolism protein YedF